MKKLLLLVLVSLLSFSAFAQFVPNADKIIEDFYSRGKYIKVIKDENNLSYFNKNDVRGFVVDEDDFYVIGSFEAFTGKIDTSASNFSIKRWNINADDEGNIIITRKKK